MRVLFIVPPEETYIGASSHKAVSYKREHRPRLGILSVATYLKLNDNSVEVKVLDCPALEITYKELEGFIVDYKPDIVGLTCLTFTYIDALKTANLVKGVNRNIKVCLGGFHVALYPQETLSNECIDFVVFGEGEITFTELISFFKNDYPQLENVKGLGFKTGSQVCINDGRELEKNLDNIPFPDYNLVDFTRYTHALSKGGITLALESSRGCPFGCKFCDMRQSKFRYRSAEKIVDEIEKWVNVEACNFFFVDDNLTINKKRVIKMCKMIVERKLKIDFKVSSRVDTVDEEILYNLKEAGCSRLSIGIESSKQENLDYLGKGITMDNIIQTIKSAHKVGLPIFAFLMLGLPGQTKEEMMEDVRFLKHYKIEYADFSICSIYPKTFLYFQSLKEGLLDHDPWPEFARNPNPDIEVPFVNDLYSPNELRDIQLEATRRFYFSFNSIIRHLKEINSWQSFFQKAKLGLRFLDLGTSQSRGGELPKAQ